LRPSFNSIISRSKRHINEFRADSQNETWLSSLHQAFRKIYPTELTDLLPRRCKVSFSSFLDIRISPVVSADLVIL